MKVKQTIHFKPSPAVIKAVESGNVGHAKHGARLFINGKEEKNEIIIPPGASSFVIEAEVGSDIALMIAAYDSKNVLSVASTFSFKVSEHPRPERPTEISLGKVVPVLEVKAAPAAGCGCGSGHTVCKEDEHEAKVFNIQVGGHKDIKQGAIGTVIGLDPSGKTVHAIFDAGALKPGIAAGPTGREYEFDIENPTDLGVDIITPEQEMITLKEYAEFIAITMAAAGV